MEEGRQVRHQNLLRLVAHAIWWVVNYSQGVDTTKREFGPLDVARTLPGFVATEQEQERIGESE